MTREQHRQRLVEAISDRKTAYVRIFGSETPESIAVREDLSRFCREFQSTFEPDPRLHALLEGRREVMLRIHDYLTLSVDQLADKILINKGRN